MTQGSRPGVPRRIVVAGVVSAVLSTTGCGIRLEDDAPRLPLLPTRTPVPAEAELVALTRATAALAALAATVPGALEADLATLHQRQHAVLGTTLLAQGVPATDLEAPPTGPPTPSASRLAGLPARGPPGGRWRARKAGPRHPPPPSPASPTTCGPPSRRCTPSGMPQPPCSPAARRPCRSSPVGGDRVGALASATAAAVYFLEVVSARSTGDQRARSDTTLAALRGPAGRPARRWRPARHLARAPPAVPGRRCRGRRAAGPRHPHHAARGLRRAPRPLVASDGGPGLAALTRWLGTVEVEAHRWGVALEPFPGLG